MKIGIFCSANADIDPDYFVLTEELGRWMGESGHRLVYGGVSLGLMECIGRAVHESGGMTIGMVPQIIEKHGRTSEYLDVTIPCDDLSDRKALMMAQADVFIALPGGIGTLDEVFTVTASHTIGYHGKMVVLYDMKGFWSSTIALLDDLQARGFIRGRWTDFIKVARSLDDIKQLIP